MSVIFAPHSEAAIRQTVERVRYASIEEAVEAAFQLLDPHDRLTRLKAVIAVGDAQIARGKGVELTAAQWDEIEPEAEETERLGVPLNSDVCP